MGDEVTPDGPGDPVEAEAEGAGPALDLMGMMRPFRPGCVMCADSHTKAIRAIHKMLTDAGLGPESEEMAQAMEQAIVMGEMVNRNPAMLAGFGQEAPPYVPVIRPMDLMVNGNSCCLVCFSQTQTSARPSGLLAAEGTLPPGLVRG